MKQPSDGEVDPVRAAFAAREHERILEANLVLLFARAYVQVTPTSEFRARLLHVLHEAVVESGVSRTAAGRAAEPTRLIPAAPSQAAGATSARRRVAHRWLLGAAAAVVFALAVWIFAFRGNTSVHSTPDAILARGAIAVREDAKGWRELETERAQRGLDLTRGSLSVATPAALDLDLRPGVPGGSAPGKITVAPNSRLWAGADAGPLGTRAELFSGAALLDLLDRGRPWLLFGADSVVLLDHGVLAARLAAAPAGEAGAECLYVTLARGTARIVDGSNRPGIVQELTVGVEVAVRNGHALAATAGNAIPAPGSARSGASVAGAGTEAGAEAQQVAALNKATLSGTITTPAAGGELGAAQPIGAYTVTLLRRERLPAISLPDARNFDGPPRFTITALPPGTYDIFVEFEDAAVWRAAGIQLEPGAAHELVIVRDAGTSVRGRVLSAPDGAPIAGAVVIVEDETPAQVIPFTTDGSAWTAATTTASDGSFRFDHLSLGAHTLRATAVGHGAAWTAHTEFDPTDEVELRLPVPGRITGQVVRSDGTPWPRALMVASHLRSDGDVSHFSYGMGTSDDSGRYEISDLPAGNYVLLNVTGARSGRDASGSRQVRVEAGRTTVADPPAAEEGASYRGRLFAADGSALAGMAVTLQPRAEQGADRWRSQMTAGDGQFEFLGVPAGDYVIFVGQNLGGEFVLQGQIVIPRGGSIERDLHLENGVIQGRATALADGSSVSGAFLLLEVERAGRFEFAGRASTDTEGNFNLRELRPATYRISVFPSQAGLAPMTSHDLWVARGSGPVTCNLALDRGASLTVRVRTALEDPVAQAEITLVDDQGRRQRMTAADFTDDVGTFTVPSIAPGRWRISAARDSRRSEPVLVELQVGETRTVVIELR